MCGLLFSIYRARINLIKICRRTITPRITESLTESLKLQLSLKARIKQVIEV
jgi:hypothetical protein